MGFIWLYTSAYISTSLLFLAPLLVTLALKVMVGNPFFGRMSDRTSSRLDMRPPWMVIGLVGGSLGILIVALAPNIPVVLVGWCIAQLLWSSCSPATGSPCSWPRARSAGSSSCSSRPA